MEILNFFRSSKYNLSCNSSLSRFRSLDVFKIVRKTYKLNLIAYELVLEVANLFSTIRDKEHAGDEKKNVLGRACCIQGEFSYCIIFTHIQVIV
jgi:hypothetical protein